MGERRVKYNGDVKGPNIVVRLVLLTWPSLLQSINKKVNVYSVGLYVEAGQVAKQLKAYKGKSADDLAKVCR